jgi:pyruvate/2-oxoglutarate dehydrogenase complex dihydrolipoamide acyltransferase (E2) component
MKELLNKIWNKVRAVSLYVWQKKRIRYSVLVVLAVVLYVVFRGGSSTAGVVTDTVKRQDLIRTVLATGQVSSTTDLNLSFTTSGVVSRVAVITGQKVKKGEVLATLDQKSAYANYTSARGALLAAKANLQKTIEGVSNEEIAVAQVALDNAKKDLEVTIAQQDTLVRNAHRALLNSGLAPVFVSGNTTSLAPTISGTYTSEKEGTYTLSVSTSGSFSVSGLSSGSGIVTTSYPQPLGKDGLFIEFPSGFNATTDGNNVWTISIPNTQASTYTTNFNAYNAALQTRASAISTAQAVVAADEAALAFKKRTARPVEVDAAQADVLSAEGKMQSAAAALEQDLIRKEF